MKVYLVRHGEVLNNVLKKYNTEDEDLTPVGINQANNLCEKLKDIDYDIIISSPLIRAKHTAKIINIKNKKIIIDEAIRERDVGNLGGKPLNVTNREEYWNYNSSIQYENSENIKVFF